MKIFEVYTAIVLFKLKTKRVEIDRAFPVSSGEE